MICRKTNTVCPNCHHQFSVVWTTSRRGRHDMCGGGTVQTPLSPLQSPQPSPDPASIFITPPLPFPPPAQQIVHVVHHHHHHHHVPSPEPQAPAEPTIPGPDIARDLRRSGWYYEGLTYPDSQELLKDKRQGTFLVRDSSDSRFLYTLSVQTKRGPTSVRIVFADGLFRLDSQQHILAQMPCFPSVVELVEHYVEESRRSDKSAHVWIDPKGKMFSPIMLTRPLIKEGQKLPSLKHLARLAVNAAMKRGATKISAPTIAQLELPASVSQYLTEYPYSI